MARIQRRLTSNDIRIELLPCSKAQVHKSVLDLGSADGGTFKLRVNGEETAAISHSTTVATLITNIDNALDALDGLKNDEVAATGTAQTALTLTSSGNKWYRIELSDHSALTGETDPSIRVTQQGATDIVLQADVMTFDYTVDVKDTEGAGIDEFEDYPFPISSGANFTISMYRTKSDEWALPLAEEGLTCLITVYPTGNLSGNEVFAFNAMINSVGDTFPFREKVEAKISGKRQGAMVKPRGTLVA